jgi:hypothetical protein
MRRIQGLLLAGIVLAFSTAQAGEGEKFFNGKDLEGFEGLISEYCRSTPSSAARRSTATSK